MPISNTNPQSNDVVLFQRDPTNTYWGEVHISGSNLIMYVDSNGFINADHSASFYTTFPVTIINIPSTGSTPTSSINATTGSTFFDFINNRLCIYNGTSWKIFESV